MGLLAAGPSYWDQFQRQTNTAGTQVPATQPAAPAPSPSSGNTGDWKAAAQAWQQSHPYGSPGSSVSDLNTYLQGLGFKTSIPTHAGGSLLSTDKIVGPDQSVIDISNDNGWQWTPDGYWVNGQPSATPNVVTQAPESNTLGNLGGMYPGASINGLQPGMGYVLPSEQDALNSPGLQFAMHQGEQGILRNAAARGTLRSGGTLKDLSSFDIGTALQGYNSLVNNQLAANKFNVGSLQDIANLGENAAALTGNFGQNYANGAGNTLQNIGNAQGANAIAGANAWGGAFNNAASSALNAYLMNKYFGGGGNASGSIYT